MAFAKWIFRIAGVYGLLVLVPQLFLEDRIAIDMPPALTHPEFFYGFLFVAIAWQFVFLLIARDPVRFRPLMPVCLLEKFPFGITCIVLYAQQRLAPQVLAGGVIDLILGTLFAIAWWRLANRRSDV